MPEQDGRLTLLCERPSSETATENVVKDRASSQRTHGRNNSMDKRIFRGARELASYTGFSDNAIHILVARGALPVHRHGRLLIFLKDEIDDFFAKLPGVTAAE